MHFTKILCHGADSPNVPKGRSGFTLRPEGSNEPPDLAIYIYIYIIFNKFFLAPKIKF